MAQLARHNVPYQPQPCAVRTDHRFSIRRVEIKTLPVQVLALCDWPLESAPATGSGSEGDDDGNIMDTVMHVAVGMHEGKGTISRRELIYEVVYNYAMNKIDTCEAIDCWVKLGAFRDMEKGMLEMVHEWG